MKDNTVIGKPIKEKVKVHYRGRERSGLGRMSLVVGILCWLIFLVIAVEARSASTDIARLGILAFIDFLLAVGGMIISGKGMRENNVFYISALAGAILNTMMVITLLSLYLVGTVI